MSAWGKCKAVLKLLTKLQFSAPGRSDVVIFDDRFPDANDTILLRSEYSSLEVLYQNDNVKIHVGFNVMFRMFLLLLANKLFIKYLLDPKINLKRVINFSYQLSLLHFMKPRVLLTFHDFNPHFLWLSFFYTAGQFISVQVSNRTPEMFMAFPRVIVEESMNAKNYCHYVFGEFEKEMLSSLDFNSDNIHPMGSLKASFCSKMMGCKVKKQVDFVFISEWDERWDLLGKCPDWRKTAVHMTLSFLSKYCANTACTILVALRQSSIFEKQFYKKYFKENVMFQESNRKDFSVYQAVYKSKVIISMSSTVAKEAIGMDQKVLICDYGWDQSEFAFQKKDMDDRFCWYTAIPKYEVFVGKLESLIDMLAKEYLKEIEFIKRKYINMQPEKPLFLELKNRIKSILE